MYLSGYFSLNGSILVDSAKSAQSATTFGLLSPSSSSALPNPSRVGTCSGPPGGGSKIFSFSFAAVFSIVLFVFALDLSFVGSKFFQKLLCFFFTWWFAVPAVVKLYFFYSLTRYGVRDDDRRLLKNCFCFFHCINKFADIVAVNLQHMPVEGLVLLPQIFKRHHLLRHTVYLDIVAVDD